MQKRIVILMAIVLVAGIAAAAPKKPLPAWETDQEKAAAKGTKVPFSLQLRIPPQVTPYGPPEYGAMEGVVIQIPTGWTQLNDYYGPMVQAIVAAKAVPYIIVADSGEKNDVIADVLTPYGVDQSEVEFYTYPYDANWTRDYGPWMIYTDNRATRALVDHHYYDKRPNDDAIPAKLGAAWGDEVFVSGFYTEGGNFMTDGLGTCWMSTGVFAKNEIADTEENRATVAQLFKDYLGCDRVFFPVSIPGEGTTHIDMYSKILDQDTIIVSYSSSEWGADAGELAQLDTAAEFYGSIDKPGGGKYTVVRIPMTYGGGSWWEPRVYYTHTNSLIVNDHVLVPTYGRGTDEAALQIYRDLMPGYTIVGIDSNDIIPQGGSIHCTTMQIPPKQYKACGDGVIAGDEECEPLYWGGVKDCTDLGYESGDLACGDDCRFDVSQCAELAADVDEIPDLPAEDDAMPDDTFPDGPVLPDDQSDIEPDIANDFDLTGSDETAADVTVDPDEDAVIVPDTGKRISTDAGCGCSVVF